MSLDELRNNANTSALDSFESSVEMVRDTRDPRDRQREENDRARLRQQEKRLRRKKNRTPGSTGNRPIQDNDIDFAPRPVQDETFPSGGGDDISFNGTVILCITGVPYYINIAYDADKGPYAVDTNSPDFPITP